MDNVLSRLAASGDVRRIARGNFLTCPQAGQRMTLEQTAARGLDRIEKDFWGVLDTCPAWRRT